MTKVSARWVPKLLTAEQKRERDQTSLYNLRRFETDPDDFVARFVTMDETWIHHFQPETKLQSKQWKHPDSPAPKTAKSVPSARKVMASVFRDSRGILLIDYLEKGQTIKGRYYADLLNQLREAIKAKR